MEFECILCSFKSLRRGAFNVHLNSRKHINKKKDIRKSDTKEDISYKSLMNELISEVNRENFKLPHNRNYVYIIKAEHGNFYKIGRSQDPNSRLHDLQTSNYSKLELVAVFNCLDSNRLESEAHKLFKEKKMRGEWFEIVLPDLLTVIRDIQGKCVEINKSHNTKPIFNTNNLVKPFIRQANEFEPFSCMYCRINFSTKFNLNRHVVKCSEKLGQEAIDKFILHKELEELRLNQILKEKEHQIALETEKLKSELALEKKENEFLRREISIKEKF